MFGLHHTAHTPHPHHITQHLPPHHRAPLTKCRGLLSDQYLQLQRDGSGWPPHTHTHARMHTRTHTHTHARTHACTHPSVCSPSLNPMAILGSGSVQMNSIMRYNTYFQFIHSLTFRIGIKGTKLALCKPFLYKSVTDKHRSNVTIITSDQSHTQPTLRRSVGGSHNHQPVVKEVREETSQYHGISNISHLGRGRGGEECLRGVRECEGM